MINKYDLFALSNICHNDYYLDTFYTYSNKNKLYKYLTDNSVLAKEPLSA